MHILVSGHTGFLGGYLLEALLQQGHQPIGLSRSQLGDTAITEIPCDLSTAKDLKSLKGLQIDGIIHTAANGNVSACEKDHKASFDINVRASIMLALFAANKDIPLVFTSSDQVFDGERGNYSPKDEALPLNIYGAHKLAAEKGIISVYPKAVVCRMPLMIGEKGGYEKALVEDLQNGIPQTLFTDEIRSVLQAEDAAKLLIEALNWPGGLYHLPGLENLNRYELGVMLARKHGLDENLLSPGLQSDVQMLAPRPKNATMVK